MINKKFGNNYNINNLSQMFSLLMSLLIEQKFYFNKFFEICIIKNV